MNRTYALVWNPSLGAWSVADEHARRRGKGAGAVLAAALLLPAMACAADLPTGGQVVAGQGQIGAPSNNQMVINQTSNKLAIDWQSFDIAAGNKVTFNQPGRDAIALNRVLGADGSKIMGQLDANGRVFLINPNGVLFGQGAQVNVGGLVASTLDISNSDFEAGRYRFKGNGSNAGVINHGQITAADGGSVALLGGTVSNNGVIVANQGSVALAAGNAMTLDFAGDGLLHVQVDEAVADALAENHQLIRADGGQVLLTAHAGEALLKTVVNNTGVIEARTLGEKDGKIVLLGDFAGGTVSVAGTLDASAPNGGNGGFVDTSGAHVQIQDGTRVTTLAANGKTGEWLIDPTDFTVSAGKAPLSDSGIGADILSANLNSTSVTLQTVAAGEDQGDIHVNAALIWNQDTTLTLNAHNDIHINASITAEHANGKLALYYGQRDGEGLGGSVDADYFINAPVNLQSGQNFSTKKGLDGGITYTVVNDADALQAMLNDLAGNYAVGSDIDLSGIANWQPVGDGSRDENNNVQRFTGKFDGLGHTLSNLTINRGDQDYVGLFGQANASEIRHVGLVGVSISGGSSVGGLVGEQVNTTISHAYVTGSVSGTGDNVGGLVGSSLGAIKNAYANASVSGKSFVGGLVGNGRGSIDNAYAAGSVTGTGDYVGGLAGFSTGRISNAYASASVAGNNNVGGLVGDNYSQGRISNAYATGSVSGNEKVGGLVGHLSGSSNTSITNAYATGRVSGTSSVGGLVGLKSNTFSTISNAYWDTQTTGQAISAGGLGRTTVQLQQAATYAGWDFSSTWSMPTDTGGYVFHHLPTLQGVTPKTGYQYFDSGAGTADNPWVLASWQQLQNINHILGDTAGKHFVLTVDLDQNSVGYHSAASATANAGAGWQPIGYGAGDTSFAGTFDGLDHTISGLTINRGGTDSVGLFGQTGNGSVIRNIGLVGGSVSGANNVGALVGLNRGSISNAYATGSVSGAGAVGGLVGHNYTVTTGGNISHAYATGSVTGTSRVGGLVGHNLNGTISNAHATGGVSASDDVAGGLVGENDSGTLRNVYAAGSVFGNGAGVGGLVGRNVYGSIYNAYVTGNVEGGSDVGGLVGYHSEGFIDDAYVTGSVSGKLGGLSVGGLVGNNYDGIISNVYATGSVSGASRVGGLVGHHEGGSISNTYATGSVSGTSRVGGLVGYNIGEISNTYATGSVSGTNNDVGGLVGHHESGSISNTYATGSVSGTSNVGGLVGNDFGFGQITASFYATTDAQGSSINNGGAATGAFAGNGIGAGKTREELTQASTFAGWDIAGTGGTNAVWRIYEGHTGPLLRSFLQQVTVSASAGGITGKTYDGNVASGTSSYTTSLSGAALDGSLTYATHSKNAGDYSQANGTLSLGGLYSGQQGYDISYANTNAALTIDKKALAVSGITAGNKTYNGTTDATLDTGNASFAGIVSGDSLSIDSASGAFTDKNAGAGKTVNITGISLGGTDAGNYTLAADTATTTANIDKASISAVSGITAGNKTYNGTTDATLDTGNASFAGIVSGDSLSIDSASGAFTDKNAGTGKTVSITGITLGGTDAGNYTLAADTATTTANIDKASISAVSGITAGNKIYNGTTAATLDTGNASFAGIVSGDSLSIGSASGAFADKNAGAGKTVNITGISLGGADAGNYTLAADTATTTANIDKASISAVSGITAANRTYNGTTDATLDTSSASFAGIVSGDSLSIDSASGAFTDKNAGAGKTVNITGISLGGTDAGNYTLAADTAATTANIDKASISAVSGITAGNKTYNGTTDATLDTSSASFAGIVSGDSLSIDSASGAFTDKNAGAGKTVNITGISLGGTDAGNYTLAADTATTTATINKAVLAVSGISASDKTYDGTTAATLSGTASVTAIGGDDVAVTGTGMGTFADKNAGTGKAVTATGYTLTGGDAGNYDLIQPTGLTATISQKALTVSGISAGNKTYNGTTDASLDTSSASFTGIVSGDSLSIGSASGAFTDKNAGAGKTVNITGISLGGADAGNYTLAADTATTTATINKAVLAVSGISASDKTYDGTTAATLDTSSASFAGIVGGDSLSIGSASGAFADKNAGTGKTVSITGISLGGTDAGNYTLAADTATTTANIDKASISAVSGITAGNKTYNGTTDATLDTSSASFVGIVSGDSLSVGSASGAFADKNAGTGKTVSITGITLGGTDAGNYTLAADTATTTANIDKASISAVSGITAGNKTYNGTTDATLDTSSASFVGIVSGDSLSVGSASGAFADKNAGAGKTVNITGITLGGADAGNYTLLSDAATTTADISKATLTISAHDASKIVGQGITLSGYSTSGLVEGDSVSSLSLTSAGEPASAVTGNYTIIASNATGSALSNYAIRYEEGTLRVSAATVESALASEKQLYDSVLASNGQTVSNGTRRQAQEPEVLTQDMLDTDPLDEHLNRHVFNHGIRMPEGT